MGWSQLQGVFCIGQVVRGSDRLAYKPESVVFSRILSEGAHVVGDHVKSFSGPQNCTYIYKPPGWNKVKGSVLEIKEIVDYCFGSGSLG